MPIEDFATTASDPHSLISQTEFITPTNMLNTQGKDNPPLPGNLGSQPALYQNKVTGTWATSRKKRNSKQHSYNGNPPQYSLTQKITDCG